ncbi:MAG: hypothetical protein ABI823_17505 [Bryobacteraceae bacterium]
MTSFDLKVLALAGGIFLLFWIFMVLPGYFYLLTLRNALALCAPESRSMSPGRVWLLWIPLFNVAWHFVVVVHVMRSLQNEYARRHIEDVTLGKTRVLGLIVCALIAGSLVPGLWLYLLGLWITLGTNFWFKICSCNERLKSTRDN